jgi:hypothetical protein
MLGEEYRTRIFENKLLRRMFGPKRCEIIGRWNKFHNEKLHNFPSSPNIVRMIKSKEMRWARRVARRRAEKNACRVLLKPRTKASTKKTHTQAGGQY